MVTFNNQGAYNLYTLNHTAMQTLKITLIALNIAYAFYKLSQSDHSAFYSCLTKVCNSLID